jgi:polyvinyl alcohol dehydrogenase (cytochrome)
MLWEKVGDSGKIMTSALWKSAAAAAAAFAFATPFGAVAQEAPNGAALFDARCKMCHDPATGRAPNRTSLAAMRASDIVDVLTNGVMAPMATGLSQPDKAAIAAYLTEAPDAHPATAAPVAAAPAAAAPGRAAAAPARPAGTDKFCETHPAISAGASDWTSVGFDTASRRFQPNPGLKAADVPKLKVKWAFAMSGGGMPTVVGDWLFITNRNGKFYALDAKTGCVHWVADAAARTTPMIVRNSLSPSGWLTLIGERNRRVRAIDAQTGKDIWQSEPLETVPAAGITGSPVISGDKVFVPLTSGEEGAAGQNTYECCKFQGSLAALDLKTGKKLWQTKVIPEPLAQLGKNSAGTQMWGPAGGAIWSAPTVDAKRGLVYVATGDSYTDAPTKGADAIVAIEAATGKIRWSNQVTENDNFIMNCDRATKPANCPTNEGPDHDFGASPILFNLPGGKQMLLAGQKSGEVYGMDPDTGRVVWKNKIGQGGALGGVEWGMAADSARLYVAISDIVLLFSETNPGVVGLPPMKPGEVAKPGLYALNPANGKVVWSAPAQKAPCTLLGDRSREYGKGACIRAHSAAPSAIPGVVFSGSTDGWFRAYDAATGKVVWAHSTTAQTYDTVNGVKGQPGGGIDGMGPAIANGMVYTMSGFQGASQTGGNGVNVLLAYSVDGK